MDIQIDTITCGDCLQVMPFIKDKSIDLILCDLPYGSTACHWDQVIPFEPLWKEYKRLIKDHGAIVLTASQPFTSALVMSNPGMFKYELIWEKTLPTNVFNAKKMFMKWHENILVFYNGLPTFNPIMTTGAPYYKKGYAQDRSAGIFGRTGEKDGYEWVNDGQRYPSAIIKISNPNNNSLHPTQKPVALFEYLIKTYTNEGDLVLDNAAGSGTTAIAALNCNRHYILIEKDHGYCEIARKRISEMPTKLSHWE